MGIMKKLMDMALEMAGLDSVPSDSGIIVDGDGIRKILVGIDMESSEMKIARDLGFDGVVGHHPKGGDALVNFSNVMDRQIDIMVRNGVPINKAQKALRKKKALVEASTHSENFDRIPSMAKLLDMPYMNIHMPADIIGENTLQSEVDMMFSGKPRVTLGEVADEIGKLGYYSGHVGSVRIRVGSRDDYAGRVIVLFAGGTNGGADVFRAYFDAGVGTIVCMHLPDDVKKSVEEQNIGNVIVANHMMSDSIGLNKIIEMWVKEGIEVTRISGIV
jgi:hypothetical protein